MLFVSGVGAALLAGCGAENPAGKAGERGSAGPAEVGFVVVRPTDVPSTVELPGRVTAYQMSEVRPQVAGIVRRRFFREGSIVHQGDTLYQIDPSVYQAQAAQAEANLQSARASAEAARIRAERYRPLAQAQAVSEQDYTDALAQSRQAAAAVAQNNAQLRSAEISLRFTRVPAPITGRVGRSLITEGSLVTTNQAEPMTVIQRLDPIYVDIQQSSAQLLALRRTPTGGQPVAASAAAHLKLEDGSDFGYTGTVRFTEVMVDPDTGTVTLRASFPNPEGILLPGMFVRAMLMQSVSRQAYLIPQAALIRDPRGGASVWVVGPGNQALQRTVVADRSQGANWVVTQGLNPGDKVIVQGTAKLKPKAAVRPVPASRPQRIETPKSGSGRGG
ncbi:MAG: efflux RND transporter periplasmic adaptor subunit [Sphingobium sp.]|nr:efflux RND transporter periplasmic adaptor subunit [Sphingobium sp.]MBP6112445.1 efflux RND transporter periplasmic adaptor subunit [Sphingobium sp.]MBP8671116.1 efflux RND transporter periplasmic adaptor subunit [Sphingobium sp.]MBP9157064.1 efflux RND transporter periplasmic adaptor subunit [Sphingobium sp.]